MLSGECQATLTDAHTQWLERSGGVCLRSGGVCLRVCVTLKNSSPGSLSVHLHVFVRLRRVLSVCDKSALRVCRYASVCVCVKIRECEYV